MNPIFAGMAVEGIGKLLGGGQKQKYAKRYRAEAQAVADEAVHAIEREKQEVKDLRAADEARLKAATGYDLKKLRDDAVKAGFNPLTILQATGGAGYDGRGAVLSTPFVSSEGAYARRLDASMGTGQAVIDGAGYVGDAIAGLGQSIVDYGTLRMQQMHEAAMLETSLRGNTSSAGAVRGTRVAGGKAGRVPSMVGAQVAVPGANAAGPPFQRKEWVFDPSGKPFQIDATWMRRNGFEPGDYLQGGDYENWLGESGQAASIRYSADPYAEIVGRDTGWHMGWAVPPEPVPEGQTRFSPRTTAIRPALSW